MYVSLYLALSIYIYIYIYITCSTVSPTASACNCSSSTSSAPSSIMYAYMCPSICIYTCVCLSNICIVRDREIAIPVRPSLPRLRRATVALAPAARPAA